MNKNKNLIMSSTPPVLRTKVLTHYTLERINWSYLLLISPINPFLFLSLSYKKGEVSI